MALMSLTLDHLANGKKILCEGIAGDDSRKGSTLKWKGRVPSYERSVETLENCDAADVF